MICNILVLLIQLAKILFCQSFNFFTSIKSKKLQK